MHQEKWYTYLDLYKTFDHASEYHNKLDELQNIQNPFIAKENQVKDEITRLEKTKMVGKGKAIIIY